MKLNVENFKELISKSSFNYLIEKVKIDITKDNIISCIGTDEMDAFSIIEKENNIIPDMKKDDEFQFVFENAVSDVKPFLNLVDGEESDLKVKDMYILIDGKYKISFGDPSIINNINSEKLKSNLPVIKEFVIDEDFMNKYVKIEKIGSKFGKIYFFIENNNLYIETTDRLNNYSNSVKFKLFDMENQEDIIMCFSYKNVTKLMRLLGKNFQDYKIKLVYFEEQERGFFFVEKEDGTEKYFIMSQND